MRNRGKGKQQSATILILKALVPYTKQNLQLAFHPNEFFNELERSSQFSRHTLEQSYNRAKNQKLLMQDERPYLTSAGRQIVQPFIAKKLSQGGKLMVIFDIPEDFSATRRRFRSLLKYLEFSQVQRSVWISSYDHKEVLIEAIDEFHINAWVQLYEAERIV